MKKYCLFICLIVIFLGGINITLSKKSKPKIQPKPLVAYLVDSTWIILDYNGKELIKTEKIVDLLGYSEGIFRVNIKYDGRVRWAIMDLKGRVTPVLFCNYLFDFSNGRALASLLVSRDTIKGEEDFRFGYINKQGRLVIPFMYKDATDFSEGLAFVMNDTMRGYIDTNNRLVIEMKNLAGNKFREGFADINDRNYKIGFINKKGEIAIPLIFDVVNPFSQNLAFAIKGDTFGFIDKKGNYKFYVDGYTARLFSNGRTFVGVLYRQKEMIWKLIDSNGVVKRNYEFEDVREFSENIAVVKKNGRWMFIDLDGNEILSNNYQYIESFVDGLAWASLSDGRRGFIDKKGEFVIEIPSDARKIIDLRLNRRVY